MEYNDLTFEQRSACSRVILEFQIRDYEIEKQRAKKHHNAHMREINRHLTACKKELDVFKAGVVKAKEPE